MFLFGSRGLAPAERQQPLSSYEVLHPPLVSLRGVAVQRPSNVERVRELEAAGPLSFDLLVGWQGRLQQYEPPGCPVVSHVLKKSHEPKLTLSRLER